MKNKKILFLLIFVLIVILLSLFFIIKNFVSINDENEFLDYTPEEEISSNQMRETVVALYFVDENNELKSEGRFIDSVSLLQNPYKEIVSLLLEGPKSNDLKSAFPENTQILDATIQNGQITLDFSSELLNFTDDIQKFNIINCLLNTLTELNEVTSFKILINNEANSNFGEDYSIK